MIERHWKGIAKEEKANSYMAHLKNETFRQIAAIEGFVSAKVLSRNLTEGVEFLVITEWQSFDAIATFAGAMLNRAVVPETVRQMMVTYDDTVTHYEVNYKC